jgi:hypothetical protein
VYENNDSLKYAAEPCDIQQYDFCDSYDETFVEVGVNSAFNTALAEYLMNVNDDIITTPKEKIEKIREKLEEHNHTLKVLNEDILDV